MQNNDEPDGMLAYTLAITNPNKNKNDPNWPIQSFDHQDWAEAFMKIVKDNNITIDEEYMWVWFANALMRGYDEARLHHAQHRPKSVRWLERFWLYYEEYIQLGGWRRWFRRRTLVTPT